VCVSFAGGTADKLGGNYERRWTANCALRILRGEAEAIEIEVLGERGTGIEFLLERAGRLEAHQVKRQHAARGRWSLSALRDEGVLKAFAAHLRSGRFPVFVSGDSPAELRELASRANAATSLEEFRLDALNATWLPPFETLCSEMEMSELEAFELLPRVTVRGATDLDLDEWNAVMVEGVFEGGAGPAIAALERVLSSELHTRLDANALWKRLEGPPYCLVRAAKDEEQLAVRVAAATDTYVAPLRALRLTHPVHRSEPTVVYEHLLDGSNEGVLVAGPAGIGKTDVILSVVEKAKADGWAVLCMRIDRLEVGATADSLGDYLELPGSPAGVLDAVAQGGPSLLVIDQLDSVSLASGRLPHFWEPVYTLIRQAAALDGMRVLLACRQFDLDGDWRLRQLTSKQHAIRAVSIEPLTNAQLDGAVVAMGIPETGLSARQRDLLRIPLHLTLLDALAAAGEVPAFETATDLLDAFWDRKQRDVAAHAGPGVRFGQVTSRLAGFMSEQQRLSMPSALVGAEDLKSDADALVSEHVLVSDRQSYAFVHESLFDYVFASGYLAAGGRVRDLLLADEQDLFRRAQVRQLLVQQRENDETLYLEDLVDLVTRPEIRFHIKQTVFSWLADLADPRPGEVNAVVDQFLGAVSDPRASLAWRVLTQPAWFDELDHRGLLDEWLGGEEAKVDMATRLLGAVVSARSDRVAALIEAHDDGSPDWLLRTVYVVRFGDVHESRRLFERLLDATARGAFGESCDHDAWLYGHELPSNQPAWAAELLEILLDRNERRASEQGKAHSMGRESRLENEHLAQEYVTRLAASDPVSFVHVAIKFFLRVIDADLADRDRPDALSDRLPADGVWGWRHINDGYGFADTLLAGLELGLQKLAETDPENFIGVIEGLAARRDDSSQFLLYRALVGNPKAFADRAAKLLLEADWRYRSGYEDQAYWATHELLTAIAPHLAPARALQLETAFIHWAPQWERTAPGHRERGLAEFNLLSGLFAALSSKGLSRLRELQRRFAAEAPLPPRGIVGGVVQSPITLEESRRMDDAAWLRAIAKHREQWEDKRSMDLIGGARELASVLQAMTQEQPDRFACLGAQLPTDTLPTYVEHLLIGLAQPEASAPVPNPENIWALLRHLALTPNEGTARYLPRVVARFAKYEPPADVVDMLVEIAMHASDPAGELWEIDAGRGTPYFGGDVWMAGMNSDRGSAAEGIGHLLAASERYVDQVIDAIRSLTTDPAVSVRACAAIAIGALMRWRRDDAIDLIPTLVDCDDRLLATQPIVQLMSAAQSTHWSVVRPIVERMLGSSSDAVRRRGASLACVASLYESGAEDLAERCVADPDAFIRRGVAEVFATNLRAARYAERCSRGLIQFFDDEDSGVREEAAKVFWRLEAEDLRLFRDVGLAFVPSRAFAADHDHFVHALERSTAEVTDLTLALAKRMLEESPEELSDVRTRGPAEARSLSALLVRSLASRRRDADARREALNWIDRLLAAGAWGVTDALVAAER